MARRISSSDQSSNSFSSPSLSFVSYLSSGHFEDSMPSSPCSCDGPYVAAVVPFSWEEKPGVVKQPAAARSIIMIDDIDKKKKLALEEGIKPPPSSSSSSISPSSSSSSPASASTSLDSYNGAGSTDLLKLGPPQLPPLLKLFADGSAQADVRLWPLPAPPGRKSVSSSPLSATAATVYSAAMAAFPITSPPDKVNSQSAVDDAGAVLVINEAPLQQHPINSTAGPISSSSRHDQYNQIISSTQLKLNNIMRNRLLHRRPDEPTSTNYEDDPFLLAMKACASSDEHHNQARNIARIAPPRSSISANIVPYSAGPTNYNSTNHGSAANSTKTNNNHSVIRAIPIRPAQQYHREYYHHQPTVGHANNPKKSTAVKSSGPPPNGCFMCRNVDHYDSIVRYKYY